jgi:hypothetical protein
MISMDEAPLVLKSVLFLSEIMTGLKMLSALNIGISGKRLDMLSINDKHEFKYMCPILTNSRNRTNIASK